MRTIDVAARHAMSDGGKNWVWRDMAFLLLLNDAGAVRSDEKIEECIF